MNNNIEIQPVKKPSIMIIDDSVTIRNQLETLINSWGVFQITNCVDGFDALSKIMDANPDLIFTDISMPRVDGYETVAMIRSNPLFSSIPIVMMSSKSGIFDIARGRLLGCDDYLVKPVAPANLKMIMTRYLGTQ